MTKAGDLCRFSYIYWIGPEWKTSFFSEVCFLKAFPLNKRLIGLLSLDSIIALLMIWCKRNNYNTRFTLFTKLFTWLVRFFLKYDKFIFLTLLSYHLLHLFLCLSDEQVTSFWRIALFSKSIWVTVTYLKSKSSLIWFLAADIIYFFAHCSGINSMRHQE